MEGRILGLEFVLVIQVRAALVRQKGEAGQMGREC